MLDDSIQRLEPSYLLSEMETAVETNSVGSKTGHDDGIEVTREWRVESYDQMDQALGSRGIVTCNRRS